MAKNKIEIIYEDQLMVAVNKPVDVSISDNRPGRKNMLELLQEQKKEDCQLLPVCQFDDKATGLIVLAKNQAALEQITGYFQTNRAQKIYLAFVEGTLLEKTGIIEKPLCQCKRDYQRVEINNKHGKDATTKWQLLADFGSISLLAVKPLGLGRHQLRVHLKHVSMPLVIDPLYGSNEPILLSEFKYNYRLNKYKEENPLIDTITLCAYQLQIDDYPAGENLLLTADIGKNFKATVKMLAKYNPNKSNCFLEKENLDRLIAAEPLTLTI